MATDKVFSITKAASTDDGTDKRTEIIRVGDAEDGLLNISVYVNNAAWNHGYLSNIKLDVKDVMALKLRLEEFIKNN